ncbi:unnamed protein product [Absidia cylindrospora]
MQQHWIFLDSTTTHPWTSHRQLRDPPPLDSFLAKHLLNLMIRFMYHSADPAKERATFFTHYLYCYADKDFTHGGWANFAVFMSHLNSSNIMFSIYERTCRVIYYISASNWALLFSKIKSCLLHLSTTREETPDTLMLRLLECSSLNSRRLSLVLAEIQLGFLQLKKNTQLNLAVLLRRGIWNWLEAYPMEFRHLQLGNKRLEGTPEILFDMCNSLADTTRKKTYYWPLQTMLLLLCPDILMDITINYDAGSFSKKSQFLHSLKMVIREDHMSEVSVICYTDICLAGHKVPKDGGSALWLLVPEVMQDLQEWFFNPTKPYIHGAEMANAGVLLDRKMLMRDADLALIQLSLKYFLTSIEHFILNDDIPLAMKASRLKCGVLVETELSHESIIPAEDYESMGNHTKQVLFLLTNVRHEQLNDPSKKNIGTNNINAVRSKSVSVPHISFGNNSNIGGNKNNNPEKMNAKDLEDMIHDILLIIRNQPSYILRCTECVNNPLEIAHVIVTIASYLNDPSPVLADVASDCIYALHQPDIVPLWDRSNTFVTNYWEISSQIILLVSDFILNHRHGKGLGLKRLVNLLKQLLASQLNTLNSYKNATPTEYNAKIWRQTHTALEVTLLVILCTTDNFIYARVMDCLDILCEEYRILEGMGETQLLRFTMHENIGAYMELVAQSNMVPGGRKSHQKGIWRALRQMTVCTLGNTRAWEEVWKRWKQITSKITSMAGNKEIISRDSTGSNGSAYGDAISGSWTENTRHSGTTTNSFTHNDSTTNSSKSTGRLSIADPTTTTTTTTDEDSSIKWEYYTGFLASLAQTCLITNDDDVQSIPSSPRYTKRQQNYKTYLSSASPSSNASDYFYRTGEAISSSMKSNEMMVDEFAGTMVDLLVCDNLMVRERVREIMGGDMTPALCWIMIRHFKLYMNACFDQKKPIYDTRRILFVDQAISVLRIMLSRHESEDVFVSIDISEFITQLCTYLNILDADDDTSKKIKIKLCQFCDSLLSKRNKFSLQKDIKVRTLLLKCIHQWTSDFDFKFSKSPWRKPPPQHQHQQRQQQNQQEENEQHQQHHEQQQQSHQEQGENRQSVDIQVPQRQQDAFQQTQQSKSSTPLTLEDNLQIDLDMACLKTMVVVLHQLPLQPTEPTREVDMIQRKSKMFYKYFTFFLKLLDRCKSSEVQMRSDSVTATTSMNQSNISAFKDNIILCLSNLLGANVDVGLKYSLSMGYHHDIQTRSAFMQVLANILMQGTEFETLAESVISDRYKRLVDLLFRFDYTVLKAMCRVCSVSETDDVATSLLTTFASEKKSLELLKLLIQNEVQQTINESDLFRKTSIATKCLTLFAKANGSDYIISVLKPVMEELISLPNEKQSFELDPNNTGHGYDEKNKENVISATRLILDAICNSPFMAPNCLRYVCHLISEAVDHRFPASKFTAVGSFVFLRLLCPVIVSPESAGLVKAGVINKRLRRGLLIIAKVIQNLANNVLFGSKEVYMVILNDFLTENLYRVTNFLRTMSNADIISDNKSTKQQDIGISPQMNDADYRLLHSVLAKNFEKIQHDLGTKKLLMFDNQESLTSWNEYMEELGMLLAQLGPPLETVRHIEHFSLQQQYVSKTNSRQYIEFMRKNISCNTNGIASMNICYASGTSLEGHCVIYFIFRRLIVDEVELESLIYHVFQVMENLYGKTFVLVIDVTQFGPANEIPKRYVTQFWELMPKSIMNNLSSVVVFNPNTRFRKYFKRGNYPVSQKINLRIVFAISLKELAELIHPSEIRLPRSTVALEKESSTTFYPVSRIMQYNIETPVTVKIGTEYIRIISNRKQEMVFGTHSLTNDVYHISDIQGFTGAGNNGDQSNQISFTSNTDKMAIVLRTPKYNHLLHTILRSKRQYDETKPSNTPDRIIRPSDVPGRLLNMALLNLGSCDSRLRLTAYNLLYSLCQTFKFSVGVNLLDTKELNIPPNCLKFITKISGRLAVTEKHLTLEFLNECFIGLDQATEDSRYLCLRYMTPWLSNLGETARGTSEEISKTREILRKLVGLSLKNIHTSIQTKMWKMLGTVDSMRDMALAASIAISKEHGLGSIEAEAMADTCVTLSGILMRSKLVATTLRLIRKTTYKPTQSLMDHPFWLDIAIMTRFILMVSFDNSGPMKNYVPDILHMVTLLIGVGPTLIRTTIHGIIVNLIQSLCISSKLSVDSRRQLQQFMGEAGEKRTQLMFGLVKPYANAFTINPDTLTDPLTEVFDLSTLQTIITGLLQILEIGAPTTDISNAWRARWMGHVTSVVFQSNPAVQPRAFVALGCLGRQQVDDDILYQILAALQHALLRFDPDNPSLVLSISMCLRNIVENLRSDSRYLISLFWVAIGLLSINHEDLTCTASELLQGVLHSMNTDHLFDKGEAAMKKLLFDARVPYGDIVYHLDRVTGVNFETHFSFAVVGVLMKGWRTPQGKDAAHQCSLTFLNCATRYEKDTVDECVLGYVASLISVARQAQARRDILRFAGVQWETPVKNINELQTTLTPEDLDDDHEQQPNSSLQPSMTKYPALPKRFSRRNLQAAWSSDTFILFNKLEIPDNDTALLFLSCLVAQLKTVENEGEQLYLYELLSNAAIIMPDVFCIVYPIMLPQMKQLVATSDSIPLLKAIQSILMSAYSDSRFQDPEVTLEDRLASLGFSAFENPSMTISSARMIEIATLAGQMVQRIIQ